MELQLDYAILVDKLDSKPLYYRIGRFFNWKKLSSDKQRQS